MNLTRAKAIRLKCLDCCCGVSAEVKLCTCVTCPLYPFRLGKSPKDEQELTAKAIIENNYEKSRSDAQKQADERRSERLRGKPIRK